MLPDVDISGNTIENHDIFMKIMKTRKYSIAILIFRLRYAVRIYIRLPEKKMSIDWILKSFSKKIAKKNHLIQKSFENHKVWPKTGQKSLIFVSPGKDLSGFTLIFGWSQLRDYSTDFYVLTRDQYQLREICNVGWFKSGFILRQKNISCDEVGKVWRKSGPLMWATLLI